LDRLDGAGRIISPFMRIAFVARNLISGERAPQEWRTAVLSEMSNLPPFAIFALAQA